jgi:hypothetical protein
VLQAELYGNPKVFTGIVKIRKGLSAQMILSLQVGTVLSDYNSYQVHT